MNKFLLFEDLSRSLGRVSIFVVGWASLQRISGSLILYEGVCVWMCICLCVCLCVCPCRWECVPWWAPVAVAGCSVYYSCLLHLCVCLVDQVKCLEVTHKYSLTPSHTNNGGGTPGDGSLDVCETRMSKLAVGLRNGYCRTLFQVKGGRRVRTMGVCVFVCVCVSMCVCVCVYVGVCPWVRSNHLT